MVSQFLNFATYSRLLLALITGLLLSHITAAQTPTRDNNMALGNPSGATTSVTDSNNYLLVRSQYALSYNNSKGMANWVSWHLSGAWKGSAVRCNCFAQDTSLPSGYYRASTGDYTGTGFDRGHLCPSDDRDGSDTDNRATFRMSNISPQAPYLNEQTWAYLEDYCRSLINENKEMYIIAGGYGSGGSGSGGGTTYNIASGAINVPAYFWKIIVVLPVDTGDLARITTSTRVIAVLMPNTQTANSHSWDYYRVSVDSIEALTGYDFLSNVDTAIQRVIEARVDNGTAVLAGWDFTGANNVATWATTTTNASLDTTGGKEFITRGSGASSSAGGNSFRTTGFQNNGISTANTDYFMVKLKATPGYTLSLSTIDATYAGTGTFCASPGVSAQYAYSLDGSTYTLIGSPFITIGTPSTMSTIDLTGITAIQNIPSTQTVYLRYYASGQTTTGGWGYYSPDTGTNGLAIGGTLNPIGTISGNLTVCAGATTTLTDTSAGGLWSSGNTSVATIGSVSGSVNGISGGTAAISYTVAGSVFTATVTVNPLPAPSAISGAATVCTGSTITLTDGIPGGIWSSGNPAVATVGSTGVVTGVTTGTASISYTVTNACGSTSVTKTVSVNSAPSAPSPITGTASVCAGSTTTLSDITAGGTWTSTNTAIATVGSTGIVSGVSAGTATISYTLSNTCGSAATTRVITVNPLPSSPAAITGATSVCVGSTITLGDATPGGAWSSSNTAIAIAGSTGSISGVASGTATISYTITNGCGSASATYPITVNPLPPVPAAITGSAALCVGSTTTLSDATPSGSWASSSTSVATIGTTGIVNGVSAGNATISYTISNGCGSAFATRVVTVNPLPSAGTISGPSFVCIGGSAAMTDISPGGVWSTSNSNALITIGGVLYGIALGTDTVIYSVSNSCGTVSASKAVTINPAPSAGSISGSSAVCTGATVTLTDAVSGGIWSATNGTATITSLGLVTGVTAGTDTIQYSVTNSCGTATATKIITVTALPSAGSIAGATSVCVTGSISLSDAAAGGIWTATNSRAIVSGSGVVYGISAGTDTIIYTVTNSCGSAATSRTVTINPLPIAGTISGPASVCAGSSITLTASMPGGVWSSSAITIATAGSTGTITGITAGSATISYTVTNGCSSAYAAQSIIINPLPSAGVITGGSSVCAGSILTLTPSAGGGIWSASNSHAFVSGGGLVYGVSAGVDTISYSVTNLCGTSVASKTVTINPLPDAGTISGPTIVCAGSTITLSDAISGGVWTSSNPAVAGIGSAGIVSGSTAGITTISYTVTNTCGTATSIHAVTVSPLPVAGTLTGASAICAGSNTALTASVPGGTWSSLDITVAIVDGTGMVSGIAAGVDTILYRVTNSCGTASVTRVMTVNPLPDAGTIIGVHEVCARAAILLTETVTGGIWSSSDSSVAQAGSTGTITGVSAGSVVISYHMSNACGIDYAVTTVTVDPLPIAGTITGPDTACLGNVYTFSNSSSGGVWSASNLNAIISASGELYGLHTGVDTIICTVSNNCGDTQASKIIVVSDCATGVMQVADDREIIIYPNPTQAVLKVRAPNPITTLTLINSVGQTVYSAKENKTTAEVDMSLLPAGIYILKVNNEKFFRVLKN